MDSLGERIQHLRKEAGFSQAALADKVKISLTQMQRYENKGVQPPADLLKRLADVFGVSIDFLVVGDSGQKAAETLKDAELISDFKRISQLPEEERNTLHKVIKAYIRDFNTQQAYSS